MFVSYNICCYVVAAAVNGVNGFYSETVARTSSVLRNPVHMSSSLLCGVDLLCLDASPFLNEQIE